MLRIPAMLRPFGLVELRVRDINALLHFVLEVLRPFGIRTIVLLPHVRYVISHMQLFVRARKLHMLIPNIAHILSPVAAILSTNDL